MNDLAEKNYRLIEGFCKKYKVDYEEYYGTLAIALVKASQNYDESKKCEFSTYAYNIMRNAVLNEMRNNSVDALFHCKSLDSTTINGDSIIELIPMQSKSENFIKFPSDMTKREKQVLNHYLQGYSLRGIADRLNLSINRVSNIYNNMIEKFRRVNGVDGKFNFKR